MVRERTDALVAGGARPTLSGIKRTQLSANLKIHDISHPDGEAVGRHFLNVDSARYHSANLALRSSGAIFPSAFLRLKTVKIADRSFLHVDAEASPKYAPEA